MKDLTIYRTDYRSGGIDWHGAWEVPAGMSHSWAWQEMKRAAGITT